MNAIKYIYTRQDNHQSVYSHNTTIKNYHTIAVSTPEYSQTTPVPTIPSETSKPNDNTTKTTSISNINKTINITPILIPISTSVNKNNRAMSAKMYHKADTKDTN